MMHDIDGIDNLERVETRTGHDLGAHEDIDIHELAEHMHAHRSHDPVREVILPPRVFREDAVQTREVRPNGFLTSQASVTSQVPVQIAYARRERLSVTIVNTGTATIYIGSTQATAQPTSGFPMPANSSLTLETVTDVWASVVSGGTSIVGVLDQFRSESAGA